MTLIFLIKKKYFLLLLVISALLISSTNAKRPYIGHHDFNSAFYSNIARNITRYPIFETKLGMVTGKVENNSNKFSYYSHNVPLYAWMLSILFKIFGVGELQARSLSIGFSIINSVFIYLIALKLFNKFIAVLSPIFFISSAMFLYFSSNVFPESVAITFSLMTYFFFLKYYENDNKFNLICMMFSALLSLLIVWGTFFLPPLLSIFYSLNKKKFSLPIILFGLSPLFIFILYFIHLGLLTSNDFTVELLNTLKFRLGIEDKTGLHSFTFAQYLKHQAQLISAYYSKVTIILVSIWFYSFLKQKGKININNWLVFLLFVWGAAYIIIFNNASYIHDYFLIYLSPFFAISAALGSFYIYKIVKKFIKKEFSRFFIYCLPLLQLMLVINFTNALFNQKNEQPYILGTYLNQNTKSTDKILIMSSQFGVHHGVVINYYADKFISYKDLATVNLINKDLENYSTVIFIAERDTPKEINKYLQKKYKSYITYPFYIYNIASE